jgi:hypothetical protein
MIISDFWTCEHCDEENHVRDAECQWCDWTTEEEVEPPFCPGCHGNHIPPMCPMEQGDYSGRNDD